MNFKFILIFTLTFIIFVTGSVTGDTGTEKLPGQKTISVTDSVGREVVIPARIQRIGCLYAFSGHVVTMLGRGNNIVAVSNGLKRDSLLHLLCPAILDARVPKSSGAINIEELLQAKPDILFIPADVERIKSEMKKLDRFGIPYLVVDYSNITEQQETINMMGKTLGKTYEASRYNNYFQDCMERVKKVTAGIPVEKRLRLYHSVNEATRTTINVSLTTDWLEVVGVINVALNRSVKIFRGKNLVSLEQILLWNPDVILANEPSVTNHILHNRQWAPLTAVKYKKIFQMPIGISRWGHPGSIETPLAILWTAKQLYPEYFEDMDMRYETKQYYKNFFDYELSNEQVTKILSGKMTRLPKKRRN